MPIHATIKLNTSTEMPIVGLGTWGSAPDVVERAVAYALKHGYRLIDTAAMYRNEREVGRGIKDSGIIRKQIFLTTKLNNSDHGNVEEALNKSLKKLDTNYLDLWLMHWPAPMDATLENPDRSRDWLDTWKEMVRIYRTNPHKLRAIGVSNFSIKLLTRLLEHSDVVPAVNQIELHPSCPQQDLVNFCNNRGIVVTAYSPLGSKHSPLLTNPVVVEMARKHNVEPANILISLQVNRPGVTVIPKTVTPARIESNLKLVELTEEEIAELQDISNTIYFRACHPSWTGWGSLGFPDCLEADGRASV